MKGAVVILLVRRGRDPLLDAIPSLGAGLAGVPEHPDHEGDTNDGEEEDDGDNEVESVLDDGFHVETPGKQIGWAPNVRSALRNGAIHLVR